MKTISLQSCAPKYNFLIYFIQEARLQSSRTVLINKSGNPDIDACKIVWFNELLTNL